MKVSVLCQFCCWVIAHQRSLRFEDLAGRGLEQVMCGERLRTGFVQHGEGKAAGRGSTKGQMESDSSVVQ